jgi:type II secretion system protein G
MKQEKSTKHHIFIKLKRCEEHQLKRKKTDPESGATFMEVLVTLAIIAILMTTIALAIGPIIDNARHTAAKSDISAMNIALTTYYAQNFDYPDESEWKQAIAPFLTKEIKTDPWGSDYMYMKPGPNDLAYGIYSAGKDKVPDSDDDIRSWEI